MLVEKVEYGGGVVETLSVDIKIKGEVNRKIIVVYSQFSSNMHSPCTEFTYAQLGETSQFFPL